MTKPRQPKLRPAAEHALAVLREIHGDGIDVADAIAQLEHALHVPRAERLPRNRWGWRFGQPLRVTSGRLDGCIAEYVRACSSTQVYVAYNGGRFAVQAAFVEPVR